MNISTDLSHISFHTTSFVFCRAQALVWVASGTSILNIFEKNASDLLSRIIIDNQTAKPTVINFAGVTNIDEHALDNLYQTLEKNDKQLIIINGNHLLESIARLKKASTAKFTAGSDFIIIGNDRAIDFENVISERDQFIDAFVRNNIASSFIRFDTERRLASTPIICNGEFNSSLIISNPHQFMWLSFFLSDLLLKVIQENKLSNVKLLSASLRGAPFASILATIHSLEFDTIDHFGPKHKIFDVDFLFKPERDVNYIYIGDFVFLGTEIKIAKTFAEMKLSKLNHAVVLGSLLDSAQFTDFRLDYLAYLKDLPVQAKFKLFDE